MIHASLKSKFIQSKPLKVASPLRVRIEIVRTRQIHHIPDQIPRRRPTLTILPLSVITHTSRLPIKSDRAALAHTSRLTPVETRP